MSCTEVPTAWKPSDPLTDPEPDTLRVSACWTAITIAYAAPGDAVNDREFAVDPSAQRTKTARVEAPPCGVGMPTVQAVPVGQTTVTGAVYVAMGHPAGPETVTWAAILLSMRTSVGEPVNVATTDLGPSIVNVSGFAEPAADPLQPVNWYPLCAVAESCTDVPAA